MAVYGKISKLPPSDDPPTDDDTPPSSGGKTETEDKEPTPVKSKSSFAKHASGAGLGTAGLLGSKDEFLFSVANSPTRKRDFDISELNM